MTRKQEWAAKLAHALMAQFGLTGWIFRYNTARRRLGVCYDPVPPDKPGRIELSRHYVELNDEAMIEDTIRHEIAHALAGAHTGHGPKWIAMCRVTGANPQRCSTEALTPPGRWRGTCGNCGQQYHRHRRPKRMEGWYCLVCGPEKGAFEWKLAS